MRRSSIGSYTAIRDSHNENEYEWLRDVHDALDRRPIKLFTFLVGQQELLAQKTALEVAGKTQIVARLMVEDLAFYGCCGRLFLLAGRSTSLAASSSLSFFHSSAIFADV
ncbi:hypothetical protein LMG24235_06561 [Paraburkholderia sabiae]|nr:hypothetical protein LMG24235_06561 [Paraburkholderia sabiae]